MKKLILIIGLFLITGQSFSQCNGVQSFTINPPPPADGYPSGTDLTVCYTMQGWNGLNNGSNWVEGFSVSVSAILTPPTPLAPPTNCDGGGGSWIWVPGQVISSATGIQAGPGWFFEVDQGGPIDGNPGNDWGDFGNCTWTFCFTTTVIQSCELENVDIEVTVGADGTWGSWGINNCNLSTFDIVSVTNDPDDFQSQLGSPLSQIVCSGSPVTFSIIDTTGESTFTPDNPITTIWDTTGQYQVSIIEQNNGCYDTTIFTVDVKPLPLVFVDGPSIMCDNLDPVLVTGLPGGGIWNPSSEFNPEYGSNWVEYIYIDEFGCQNSDSTFINVLQSPDAQIISGLRFIKCIESDKGHLYSVPLIWGSSWTWILNGDTLSETSNEVLVYFQNLSGDTNTIEVFQTNEYGCVGLISEVIINSEKCGNIYIPNTFSPNSDNINDLFRIQCESEITNFEMVIFDRWGELIYSFRNQEDFWNGSNCQNGVYIWKVSGKIGKNPINKIGNVNLIR